LDCRPNVEIDHERVIKDTAAFEIKKGYIQTRGALDAGDKVEMFKNDGYTVDKLMKDVRFRVGAALNNAGVNNMSYAKELMSGLPSHQGAMQASNIMKLSWATF